MSSRKGFLCVPAAAFVLFSKCLRKGLLVILLLVRLSHLCSLILCVLFRNYTFESCLKRVEVIW